MTSPRGAWKVEDQISDLLSSLLQSNYNKHDSQLGDITKRRSSIEPGTVDQTGNDDHDDLLKKRDSSMADILARLYSEIDASSGFIAKVLDTQQENLTLQQYRLSTSHTRLQRAIEDEKDPTNTADAASLLCSLRGLDLTSVLQKAYRECVITAILPIHIRTRLMNSDDDRKAKVTPVETFESDLHYLQSTWQALIIRQLEEEYLKRSPTNIAAGKGVHDSSTTSSDLSSLLADVPDILERKLEIDFYRPLKNSYDEYCTRVISKVALCCDLICDLCSSTEFDMQLLCALLDFEEKLSVVQDELSCELSDETAYEALLLNDIQSHRKEEHYPDAQIRLVLNDSAGIMDNVLLSQQMIPIRIERVLLDEVVTYMKQIDQPLAILQEACNQHDTLSTTRWFSLTEHRTFVDLSNRLDAMSHTEILEPK